MALLRRTKVAQSEFFPGFVDIVEIGVGSLATVYRAREIGTNRLVALKLLNVRDASPRAIESFERESIALGAVSSHPNIVTLYRSFRAGDGRPVLVLELCSGAMSDRMREGNGLPVPEVVSMGIKIAGALETAHRAEILHRDVKPQNILITDFGEPALADFGVAMLQSSTQTTAGLFDFTTLHAAPELLEGGETSAATDVYELASSIYQLIAGRSAFRAYDGESPASVILRILRDPVLPLGDLQVPTMLSDLLIYAMSKDKDSRPPTAAEFAAELAAIEIEQGWPRTQFLIRDPRVPGGAVGLPQITRIPVPVTRRAPSEPVAPEPAPAPPAPAPPAPAPSTPEPAAAEPAAPVETAAVETAPAVEVSAVEVPAVESRPRWMPAPYGPADPPPVAVTPEPAPTPEPEPTSEPEPRPEPEPAEPEPAEPERVLARQPVRIDDESADVFTPRHGVAGERVASWYLGPDPATNGGSGADADVDPVLAASEAVAEVVPAADPPVEPQPASMPTTVLPPPEATVVAESSPVPQPSWVPVPPPAFSAPPTTAPLTPAPLTPAPLTPAPQPATAPPAFPATAPPAFPASHSEWAPPPPPAWSAPPPQDAVRYAIPPSAHGAGGPGTVPTWAVREPWGQTHPGQGAGRAPTDPASLRPRHTVLSRAGLDALTVDGSGLRLRVGLRRTQLAWGEVYGFEPRFDAATVGVSGRLVAITRSGPVDLPATRRPTGELRRLHELLDAYHHRARILSGS